MQQKPQQNNRRTQSLDGFVQKKPAIRPGVTSRRPISAQRTLDTDTAPRLSASQLSSYLRAGADRSTHDIQPPAPKPVARIDSMKPSQPLSASSATEARVTEMNPRRRPIAADTRIDENSEHTPTTKRRWGRKNKVKKIHKHPLRRKILLRTGGAVGALVLIIGGFLGWKVFSNTGKIFGGNVISNIGALVNSAPLKGQETGRVNILLAGNSSDDVGHDGASLTDSIMIVSIDTKNNKAFMLSIPRDFWVNIPGVGYRKINEANYWGDENGFSENGYPEGGMGLLEKTIETNLEIDLHYYALINYGAFKDTVDAVGGITVTIESSDSRGLYDPTFQAWEGGALKLSNGPHELDGNTALKLARARGHDGGYGYSSSDFVRTENQRKMLIALKNKAVSAGTLSNPLKIGNLLDSIGDNVKTDFKLNEMMTLAGLGKKISDIKSLSFQSEDIQLLSNYTSPTGQSALIPSTGLGDYTDIIKFLKQHMSTDPVLQEAPSVAILNGTDADGLASGQKTVMDTKGLTVDSIGSAVSGYDKTTIIDVSSGKAATKKYLQQTYSGSTFTSERIETVPEGVDFVIILGKDFAAKQTSASTR